MEKTATNVLKSDQVKFEGRLKLDFILPGSSPAKTKTAPLVAPQARIVENNSEFAIIEVTCSCGARTQLKCNYTPTNNTQSK